MPIHIAISRQVRPGCEAEFQQALREFFQAAFAHGQSVDRFPAFTTTAEAAIGAELVQRLRLDCDGSHLTGDAKAFALVQILTESPAPKAGRAIQSELPCKYVTA